MKCSNDSTQIFSFMIGKFNNSHTYHKFKTILSINRILNQCILIKKLHKKLKSIFEVNGHYGSSNSKFGKC